LKDGKLPPEFTNDLILKKFESITNKIDKFFQLKKIDSQNEKFPILMYNK